MNPAPSGSVGVKLSRGFPRGDNGWIKGPRNLVVLGGGHLTKTHGLLE